MFIVTICNYFKRTNIQITILTNLARRNVLAYGTFGGVVFKLQVFSGFSHRWHTNIINRFRAMWSKDYQRGSGVLASALAVFRPDSMQAIKF